jgi:PadR family transcriptional regulator, regulatory protein PadR
VSDAEQMPFLKGTVDMLVLKALSWGQMHGFAITLWLDDASGGALGLDDSAVYQILHRLEGRGFIDAQWKTTENNRRAKFYKLTSAGRTHLGREAESWARYSKTVSAVMSLKTRGAEA